MRVLNLFTLKYLFDSRQDTFYCFYSIFYLNCYLIGCKVTKNVAYSIEFMEKNENDAKSNAIFIIIERENCKFALQL